ncbi:MAG: hypothetical protein QOE70_6124 [Chthoniobacter sp.]|jgi:lysophospholipase L1-like esterase|nr:hypothetical protein [Chthoniobacter sp.]
MKPTPIALRLGSVLFLAGVGVAAAGVYFARVHYIRGKAALAQPVRFDLYREANQALLARSTDIDGKRRSRVVVIGDSTISRWNFDDAPEDWEIVNRGVAGETSAQLIYRFAADATALRPEVVVIQTGVNDLVAASLLGPRGEALVPLVAENLKAIALQGAEAGFEVILITLVPPARPELVRRPIWNKKIYRQVRQVNETLLRWVPPDRVTVVDHAAVFGPADVLAPRFASDALHFSEEGYIRFKELVVRAVGEALQRR